MTLTPRQKQYLRGLAHPQEPIVRVGRAGVSEAVIEETRRTLDAHELIKVRLDADDSATRKELAASLAVAVSAEVAGTVGKIAILYRADAEKPKIKLPA